MEKDFLDPHVIELREARIQQLEADGEAHNKSLEQRVLEFQETLTTELSKDVERLQHRLDEIAIFLYDIKIILKKASEWAFWLIAIVAIYVLFKTYHNAL